MQQWCGECNFCVNSPVPNSYRFSQRGPEATFHKVVCITERDPFLWELLFNTMGSKYSCPLLWRKHCHYVLRLSTIFASLKVIWDTCQCCLLAPVDMRHLWRNAPQHYPIYTKYEHPQSSRKQCKKWLNKVMSDIVNIFKENKAEMFLTLWQGSSS